VCGLSPPPPHYCYRHKVSVIKILGLAEEVQRGHHAE
jgi:hypothetical protein